MRTALFILAILLLSVQTLCAQKIYTVSLYDGSMFLDNRHFGGRFKHQPRLPGKYVVLDYGDISKRRIWRVFYINGDGSLIDRDEYCCGFEEIALKDGGGGTGTCNEQDVYVLNEVIIYGCQVKEKDVVQVRSFKKNGRFDKPLKRHTARVSNLQPYTDTLQQMKLDYTALSAARDYEIVLNTDTFRITGISTALYRPENKVIGDFCTMYSYELNGKKVFSNFITLVKPGYEKRYINSMVTRENSTRQNGKKADRPLKEIHYLPRNYTGKVAVIFNQPQGKMIEYAGDYRIYRIPECGILKTNFLLPNKISYSSVNEDVLFVYSDKNGKITDTIHFLPNFRQMDEKAYEEFMYQNRNKIFIFEWGFGGFSNGKENYRNVESYIIDTLKNKKNYRYLDFGEYDFGKCN